MTDKWGLERVVHGIAIGGRKAGKTMQLEKEAYQVLLAVNPIRLLRERAKLSQSDAAEMMGYSVQYIYRIENGLVNVVPREYIKQLGIRYVNDPRDFTVDYYERAWEDWRASMRASVARVIGQDQARIFTHPNKVSGNQTNNPLLTFIGNFNVLVCTRLGLDEVKKNPQSMQLFNRLLCLYPRSVQLYLQRRSTAEIMGNFADALSDVGITAEWQKHLEHEVQMWMAWQKLVGI